MMDISPLLRFEWYEPIFCSNDNSTFSSESGEKLGHFVGIQETVGHAMTFKILTEDTNKVNDILRNLIIGAWQSEPHMQHQNPAERRWQTVKRLANTIMD